MSFLLADIDVARPLPTLSLAPHHTGVAVLLRRKGRPVDFWMEDLPAGRVLTPSDLADRIGWYEGWQVLRERLREELAPPAAPAQPPTLTIAICTKDRPEQLARCLDSLRGLEPVDGQASSAADILVVDNAPSDEQARDQVAARPGVRYVREPRPGLNFARNRALQEADGDLIAFLDDDVTVDRYWLAGLMEAWAEHPDAACFTGLVLPYALDTEAQILFERRGGFRKGFKKIRYGKSLPGNPAYPCGAGIFGTGANMAFRRDVVQELGGFDEALDAGAPLPGGGDIDMFYRVIRGGYALVYEPRCLVFHEHRRDLDALHRQYRDSWGKALMAFAAKCYRTDPSQRARVRRLVAWWFRDQARWLRRSLRRRDVHPPRTALAELGGGVVGLLGEYARSQKRVDALRRRIP